jgi:hypothetical protein
MQDRAAVGRLTAQERVELALRLGEQDLELFCAARQLDRATGFHLLRRQRQEGRVPSLCMSARMD